MVQAGGDNFHSWNSFYGTLFEEDIANMGRHTAHGLHDYQKTAGSQKFRPFKLPRFHTA
jgi:hypothetical protein